MASVEKGPLVARLESLKRRSVTDSDRCRLAVDYFVDAEDTSIQPADVKQTLHRLSRTEEGESKGTGSTGQGRKILFVSGPPGFLEYWAGPKEWAEGREVQGPLRGVLTTLRLEGWEVVKL